MRLTCPVWSIKWARQDQSFYAIEAVIPPLATQDDVRAMFRGLLVERFKLATHREQSDMQGYALMISKSGLKAKPATPGEAPPLPNSLGGGADDRIEGHILVTLQGPGVAALTGRGASMTQLAQTVSESLQTPVWNETHQIGKFYFGFIFTRGIQPTDDLGVPSLATALNEFLGLRFEKKKGPVEILVIDRIEPPSEN